jgi:hypothetical protein
LELDIKKDGKKQNKGREITKEIIQIKERDIKIEITKERYTEKRMTRVRH